jgi:hypothetical protein
MRLKLINMRYLIPLAAILALALAFACGDDDDSDDSTADEDPTTPAAEDQYEFDLFDVDSVEVLTLESFPVQITVAAHGTLPGSSCTEVHDVSVEQEGNAFAVTIETRRLKDAVCTADIAEHTENVNLGSPEPGDYTVTVNDVSAEFSVPGEGDGGASDPGQSGSSGGDGQASGGDAGECDDYSGAPPDQAVSSDDPPPCPPEPIDESEYVLGEFQVESVDVLLAESFPVQVFVAANGYLGDGCTEIHEVDVQQNGNEFVVTITTRRPAGAICTQQLVGHTENVGLGSPPPGDYTVTVNGVSESFTVPG